MRAVEDRWDVTIFHVREGEFTQKGTDDRFGYEVHFDHATKEMNSIRVWRIEGSFDLATAALRQEIAEELLRVVGDAE